MGEVVVEGEFDPRSHRSDSRARARSMDAMRRCAISRGVVVIVVVIVVVVVVMAHRLSALFGAEHPRPPPSIGAGQGAWTRSMARNQWMHAGGGVVAPAL